MPWEGEAGTALWHERGDTRSLGQLATRSWGLLQQDPAVTQ